MDFRQLRYFVEVADAGSFSRAASLLSVAQPALSRQVRQLEETLGAPLFHRNGRGVVLTPAGAILLEHAREMIERASRAARDIATLRGAPAGMVTLGVPPSVSGMLLAPLLAHASDRLPGVRLNVMEGFSGTVLDWLQTGRVDLAIIYDVRRSASILAETLIVEDMFLVRRPDGPGAATIEVAALSSLPLVLPSRPHGLRLLVESAMRECGLRPEIRFEIDSMPIMKELAEKGVAATILPFGAVADEVDAGRLAASRIVAPDMSRTMVLATAAQRPVDMTVRAVIDAIRTIVRDRIASRRWLGRARA